MFVRRGKTLCKKGEGKNPPPVIEGTQQNVGMLCGLNVCQTSGGKTGAVMRTPSLYYISGSIASTG